MPLFVGSISGTSVDGLDLALVEIDDQNLQIRHAETVSFPESLRSRLARLARPGRDELVEMGHSHAALGTFIGNSINDFLRKAEVHPREVRAVGSHGQTVRHYPEGEEAFTLQIGDPSRIVEITGVDTVADFRSRDIAAGGVGAPLAPIFHQRLFQTDRFDRIVLNIGGIANVTYLASSPERPCEGFDTGPGNALLDAYVNEKLDERFDSEGRIASSGYVDDSLLDQFLSDPWFEETPPKSTGKEHFDYAYVRSNLRSAGGQMDDADVLATLAELTAASIVNAIKQWCCNSGEIVVCGGGRLNLHLMRRLAERATDFKLMPCERLGIDGDAVEAAAFAYLAYLFVNRMPGNAPQVTGAVGERVIGSLYPAR